MAGSYSLHGRLTRRRLIQGLEWARLPRYYAMDLDNGMAETVASEMPSAAQR